MAVAARAALPGHPLRAAAAAAAPTSLPRMDVAGFVGLRRARAARHAGGGRGRRRGSRRSSAATLPLAWDAGDGRDGHAPSSAPAVRGVLRATAGGAAGSCGSPSDGRRARPVPTARRAAQPARPARARVRADGARQRVRASSVGAWAADLRVGAGAGRRADPVDGVDRAAGADGAVAPASPAAALRLEAGDAAARGDLLRVRTDDGTLLFAAVDGVRTRPAAGPAPPGPDRRDRGGRRLPAVAARDRHRGRATCWAAGARVARGPRRCPRPPDGRRPRPAGRRARRPDGAHDRPKAPGSGSPSAGGTWWVVVDDGPIAARRRPTRGPRPGPGVPPRDDAAGCSPTRRTPWRRPGRRPAPDPAPRAAAGRRVDRLRARARRRRRGDHARSAGPRPRARPRRGSSATCPRTSGASGPTPCRPLGRGRRGRARRGGAAPPARRRSATPGCPRPARRRPPRRAGSAGPDRAGRRLDAARRGDIRAIAVPRPGPRDGRRRAARRRRPTSSATRRRSRARCAGIHALLESTRSRCSPSRTPAAGLDASTATPRPPRRLRLLDAAPPEPTLRRLRDPARPTRPRRGWTGSARRPTASGSPGRASVRDGVRASGGRARAGDLGAPRDRRAAGGRDTPASRPPAPGRPAVPRPGGRTGHGRSDWSRAVARRHRPGRRATARRSRTRRVGQVVAVQAARRPPVRRARRRARGALAAAGHGAGRGARPPRPAARRRVPHARRPAPATTSRAAPGAEGDPLHVLSYGGAVPPVGRDVADPAAAGIRGRATPCRSGRRPTGPRRRASADARPASRALPPDGAVLGRAAPQRAASAAPGSPPPTCRCATSSRSTGRSRGRPAAAPGRAGSTSSAGRRAGFLRARAPTPSATTRAAADQRPAAAGACSGRLALLHGPELRLRAQRRRLPRAGSSAASRRCSALLFARGAFAGAPRGRGVPGRRSATRRTRRRASTPAGCRRAQGRAVACRSSSSPSGWCGPATGSPWRCA